MDEGFILDKRIGVGQPKRIENARILVANTAMDTDKIKIYGARVRVDSMQKVRRQGALHAAPSPARPTRPPSLKLAGRSGLWPVNVLARNSSLVVVVVADTHLALHLGSEGPHVPFLYCCYVPPE